MNFSYKKPKFINCPNEQNIKNKSMRNFISTPNIRIKRKIRKKFDILSIDEYSTSIINSVTHIRENDHFKYKDKNNKTRSLYSVLTYKMENNRFGCINRDLNAVRNIYMTII